VRVNAGGEPERDDFPLPPVDIKVPDDARELDREVQAYHREQRAARRRRRLGRLHAPLTKDGLVLPLLAGCLVMVMVSGVLLTVFSASNSGAPVTAFRSSSSSSPQNPQISAAGSSTASPPPTNTPANPPPTNPPPINPQVRFLVEANVAVGGHVEPVYRLLPGVLALAPAGCQCTAALRQLRRQAAAHKVPLYLITTADMQPATARLARAAGLPASRIVQDRTGQVTAELSPSYNAPALAAAFVRGNGSIAVLRYNLPGHSRPAARRLAPGFAALAAKP
jgi:hypothetical protein